jgi:hypothetical protein
MLFPQIGAHSFALGVCSQTPCGTPGFLRAFACYIIGAVAPRFVCSFKQWQRTYWLSYQVMCWLPYSCLWNPKTSWSPASSLSTVQHILSCLLSKIYAVKHRDKFTFCLRDPKVHHRPENSVWYSTRIPRLQYDACYCIIRKLLGTKGCRMKTSVKLSIINGNFPTRKWKLSV